MPLYALLAASLLIVMQGALVAPALPAIERAFASSPHAALLARLVLPAPALAIGLTAPLTSLLAAKLGRRPLMATALVLYAVAGALCGLAGSLTLLVAARIGLGVAVGAIMSLLLTLISDIEQERRRTRVFGLQGMTMALGGAVAALGGGLLAELGWRWTFAPYLLALALLPSLRPAMNRVPEGARKRSESLLPLPPRPAVPVIVLGTVVTFAYFVIPVQGPFFFEARYGFGESTLGLLFAGLVLAVSGGSVLFPKVRKRIAPPIIYTITQIVLAAGLLLLAMGPPLWGMVALLAVGGIALGILTPLHADAIAARVAEADRTRAMSVYTAIVFLAQFAVPFATQPLAVHFSIEATFVGMGLLLLLSGGISTLLLRVGR